MQRRVAPAVVTAAGLALRALQRRGEAASSILAVARSAALGGLARSAAARVPPARYWLF